MIKKVLPPINDKPDKLIFMLCHLRANRQMQALAPLEFVGFVGFPLFTHFIQYIYIMGEYCQKTDCWMGSVSYAHKKATPLLGGFGLGWGLL